ncbi:hypothetical protein LY78DRAFT_338363 [Colletotrichum sublineola]|nr:hypothetical protein LY78DRAFT_338363 [Colletotrichum sublineola]
MEVLNSIHRDVWLFTADIFLSLTYLSIFVRFAPRRPSSFDRSTCLLSEARERVPIALMQDRVKIDDCPPTHIYIHTSLGKMGNESTKTLKSIRMYYVRSCSTIRYEAFGRSLG